MCDVWSPRATNGVGESQGHYVEAVRALETLLSVSLCFLSTLVHIPQPKPEPTHKDTSVATMKTEQREHRSDIYKRREKAEKNVGRQ